MSEALLNFNGSWGLNEKFAFSLLLYTLADVGFSQEFLMSCVARCSFSE
jgi:hypothetical protein